MIGIANEDSSPYTLLLEMALKAERGIPRGQHPLIDRAVGRVAGNTAFADGIVFEHKRSSLGGVTLETRLVSR